MLMALLYNEDGSVAAAAPACDQVPYGEVYWTDIFAGDLPSGPLFETAYISVNNANLRRRLLLLGFDDEICGIDLANELESNTRPDYLPIRAA